LSYWTHCRKQTKSLCKLGKLLEIVSHKTSYSLVLNQTSKLDVDTIAFWYI
jgi:hypothetical protein